MHGCLSTPIRRAPILPYVSMVSHADGSMGCDYLCSKDFIFVFNIPSILPLLRRIRLRYRHTSIIAPRTASMTPKMALIVAYSNRYAEKGASRAVFGDEGFVLNTKR